MILTILNQSTVPVNERGLKNKKSIAEADPRNDTDAQEGNLSRG